MSSVFNDYRTLPINEALGRNLLIRQVGAGWSLCGAGQVPDAINTVLTDAVMAANGWQSAGMLLEQGRGALLVAAVAIAVGDKVYPAASGKITNIASGTHIGIAREAASGDGSEICVELRPDLQRWFAAITGPSTNIAGQTAETTYDKTITIGAGVLRKDSVARIRGRVLVSAQAGVETLTLRVKLADGTNTITVAISPAIDVAVNDVGNFEVEVHFRSATSLVAYGRIGLGTETTATDRPTGIGASTVDTTAAITVSVTQASSGTGQTSALQALTVDIIR